MAFKEHKIIKGIARTVPVIFVAGFVGVMVGKCARDSVDAKLQSKIDAYKTTLVASGEVGNISLDCVLPFGDRQIVLTKSYTDDVKSILEEDDYPLLVKSCTESLEQFNNLKIGYNFTLCSEDGSLGLPKPEKNIPIVAWTTSNDLDSRTLGQWYYNKSAFGEEFYFAQSPKTLDQISYPAGLETFVTTSNLNSLDHITIYGKDYSPARMLYNHKIFMHELEHSIGVGHITSNLDVPKNEAGVSETYMTSLINYAYAGDSKFDENTLIAATSLRKILANEENQNDKYFDNSHFETFYDFMEKGQNNLNNQNSMN